MKKITVKVTETTKVTHDREIELPCYMKWSFTYIHKYVKIIDEKSVIEVSTGPMAWGIEYEQPTTITHYMDRDQWTPIAAKDFYIALEKALAKTFEIVNRDAGGLVQVPEKTIQPGDSFAHNGHIHTCVGTDEGKIWYCEDEFSEAISADPCDCILIAEPSTLGTL